MLAVLLIRRCGDFASFLEETFQRVIFYALTGQRTDPAGEAQAVGVVCALRANLARLCDPPVPRCRRRRRSAENTDASHASTNRVLRVALARAEEIAPACTESADGRRAAAALLTLRGVELLLMHVNHSGLTAAPAGGRVTRLATLASRSLIHCHMAEVMQIYRDLLASPLVRRALRPHES